MGKPAYESLGEFFQEIETYHGGWDGYRQKFLTYPPNNRVIELSAFDQLLGAEHRPTRQTAEYITKRRELGDLDAMLRRAQR
jgi:hypothetical protein